MARVLLIEDNPANLELMAYLLRAFGHEALEASGGHAGVDRARREPCDLILCDIQLPDVDGYEVARLIKADVALRRVPLVAITAFAMVGDRDRALAAGFDGYITKPLVPETFVAQVETFLRPEQRSAPLAPESPALANTPLPPAHATILVVDDSWINIDLLRGILEPSGYLVWATENMGEALARARQSAPDLIVTDLHMAGGGGDDLVRALKADARLAQIPIIIQSASIEWPWSQADLLALGAARFIPRPLEPQLLLQEIEACLAAGGKR
jgi:two-component system cell cycle response regulator